MDFIKPIINNTVIIWEEIRSCSNTWDQFHYMTILINYIQDGGDYTGGITAPVPTPAAGNMTHLPEVESFQVELHKDNQGKEFNQSLSFHVSRLLVVCIVMGFNIF